TAPISSSQSSPARPGVRPSNSATLTPPETARPSARISSARGGSASTASIPASKPSNMRRSKRLSGGLSSVRTASPPSRSTLTAVPSLPMRAWTIEGAARKGDEMKVGVLGTGSVGRRIAAKLVELGHEVTMGSRSADNEALREWVEEVGQGGSGGTFADAAAAGELVFNCTAGEASLAALEAAGADNLAGKVLVDVSNPLDFSQGMPPTLSICNDDSLGERIQAAFPEAKVVKTLNTVNAGVMVDPASVPGEHDIFVCGNDDGAKAQVSELLQSF